MICPRCGRHCRIGKGGKMSEHKTDNYALGQHPNGRVRERCVYSGGTLQDARDKITTLRRAMIDRGELS